MSFAFEGYEGSYCEDPACLKSFTAAELRRAAQESGASFCDDCVIVQEASGDWDARFLDLLGKLR